MRKLEIIIAAVALLFLAGCESGAFSEKVNQIRGFVQGKCGFIPTIASVTDVLLQAGGAVASVGAMGKEICTALTEQPVTGKVNTLTSGGDVADGCKAFVRGVCVEAEQAPADER